MIRIYFTWGFNVLSEIPFLHLDVQMNREDTWKKVWKPRLCWPISISGANRACLVAFSIDSWEAEYSISARTLSSASLKIQCIISGRTDGWGLAGRISYLYLKIPKMVPPRNKTLSTNTSVQSITLKGFENNTSGNQEEFFQNITGAKTNSSNNVSRARQAPRPVMPKIVFEESVMSLITFINDYKRSYKGSRFQFKIVFLFEISIINFGCIRWLCSVCIQFRVEFFCRIEFLICWSPSACRCTNYPFDSRWASICNWLRKVVK